MMAISLTGLTLIVNIVNLATRYNHCKRTYNQAN